MVTLAMVTNLMNLSSYDATQFRVCGQLSSTNLATLQILSSYFEEEHSPEGYDEDDG
jgi:hypothetical protein